MLNDNPLANQIKWALEELEQYRRVIGVYKPYVCGTGHKILIHGDSPTWTCYVCGERMRYDWETKFNTTQFIYFVWGWVINCPQERMDRAAETDPDLFKEKLEDRLLLEDLMFQAKLWAKDPPHPFRPPHEWHLVMALTILRHHPVLQRELAQHMVDLKPDGRAWDIATAKFILENGCQSGTS